MMFRVVASAPIAKNKVRVACLAISAAVLFTVCAPVALVAAQTEVVATNNDTAVTSTEVKNALGSVPGILTNSDQVATKSDGNSALAANVNGTVVDIPKDPTEGVTFGAQSGPKLDITLPNADEAGAAKRVAPGVVAYDTGNGSANAVQATEDGGVRMLTIIDNPNAPTAYDYKVSVPNGGKVELTADGGAIVLARDNSSISMVSPPWAKDATGRGINTWFTTDGKTLTQHVQHNVAGVVYPVTADPFWIPSVAALAGAIAWMAFACAADAAADIIWAGGKWAIIRGDWNWTNRAKSAADNCLRGIIWGGAGKFIPGFLKHSVNSFLKNQVTNYLLWLVKR